MSSSLGMTDVAVRMLRAAFCSGVSCSMRPAARSWMAATSCGLETSTSSIPRSAAPTGGRPGSLAPHSGQGVGEISSVVDRVGRGRSTDLAHQPDNDTRQRRGEARVDPRLVVLGQEAVPSLRRYGRHGGSRQALYDLPLPVLPHLLGGEHLTYPYEAFQLLVHAVSADPGRGLVTRLERHFRGRPPLELMDALLPGQAHLSRHICGYEGGYVAVVAELARVRASDQKWPVGSAQPRRDCVPVRLLPEFHQFPPGSRQATVRTYRRRRKISALEQNWSG